MVKNRNIVPDNLKKIKNVFMLKKTQIICNQ